MFPYSRVVVHVTQPAADRAAIEAVFSQLDARLRERLAEIRCEFPASLTASVSVTNSTNGHDPLLRVECSNDGVLRPAGGTRGTRGNCRNCRYAC